jgi:homoaconitase/3-isopropylmalate dehydratase large subunit
MLNVNCAQQDHRWPTQVAVELASYPMARRVHHRHYVQEYGVHRLAHLHHIPGDGLAHSVRSNDGAVPPAMK